MPIYKIDQKTPQIAASAWVAPQRHGDRRRPPG